MSMAFLPAGMSGLDVFLVLVACAIGTYAVIGPAPTKEDRCAQTILIILFLPFTLSTIGYGLLWVSTLFGMWRTPGATTGSVSAALNTVSSHALAGLLTGSLLTSIITAISMRIRHRRLPPRSGTS